MIDVVESRRPTGIPFSTVRNARAHYPETKTTPKGHLDEQRQGVRPKKATDGWAHPDTSLTRVKKEEEKFIRVWDLNHMT